MINFQYEEEEQIVELMKELRSVTIQLEKSKRLNSVYEKKLQERDFTGSTGLKEFVSRPSNEDYKRNDNVGSEDTRYVRSPNGSTISSSSSSNNAVLKKKLEDERIKNFSMKKELDNAIRLLKEEVGPGYEILLERGEGLGWKGRAQQIILLKSQLKDMKQKLEEFNYGRAEDVTLRSRSDIGKGKKTLDISQEMEKEMEELRTENEELKSKLKASIARRKNLEATVSDLRQKVKVLLDKTSTDDKLIELLRTKSMTD